MNVVQVWDRDLATGSLPPICALTGQPTSGTKRVRYASSPGWIGWLILFGGFVPFVVAWLFTQRVARGLLPLSPAAQRRLARFGWQVLGVRLSLLAVVAVIAWIAIAVVPGTAAVSLLLGIIAAVAATFGCDHWYRSTVIRGYVGEQTPWGRLVTLINVNPTFADAVQRMYEQRRLELQRAS